jgi:hypothetical protein
MFPEDVVIAEKHPNKRQKKQAEKTAEIENDLVMTGEQASINSFKSFHRQMLKIV